MKVKCGKIYFMPLAYDMEDKNIIKGVSILDWGWLEASEACCLVLC